jgi:hypothetical protein
MPQSDELRLLEYKFQVLDARQKELDEELKVAEAAITRLNEERTKALKWGITTLGSLVLFLGGLIVKYITEHIK